MEQLSLGRRHLLQLATGAALAPTAAKATSINIFVEGPRSTIVPLQKAPDDKLYFMAAIGGRSLRLFVDTGASTILDLGITKELRVNLSEIEQEGFGITGIVGKRISGQVDMQLGQFKITGAPIDCMDLAPLRALSRANRMPEFDGLLGAGLLLLLKAEIDFGRLELRLRRPV